MAQLAPKLAVGSPLLPTSPQTPQEAEQEQKAQRDPHDDPLRCTESIYMSFFFDGTRNNKEADMPLQRHSNVARLYNVCRDDRGKRHFRSYIAGVGTRFASKDESGDPGIGSYATAGAASAWGGEGRINWALLQLQNNLHTRYTGRSLSEVLGTNDRAEVRRMSDDMQRNAQDIEQIAQSKSPILPGYQQDIALRRVAGFTGKLWDIVKQNWDGPEQWKRRLVLAERNAELQKRLAGVLQNKPTVKQIKLYVYGFSRGAAEARTFLHWLRDGYWDAATGELQLCGIAMKVEFVGLFDSVASVGVAHAVHVLDGHGGWAEPPSQRLPSYVGRCLHLVAAHEVRGSFPLDLCDGADEVVYPGVHSDVGGGYRPGEQGKGRSDADKLSQIPLCHMYRAARQAGAPLDLHAPNVAERDRNAFQISDALRTRFNAYLDACTALQSAKTHGTRDASRGAKHDSQATAHPVRTDAQTLIHQQYELYIRWRSCRQKNLTAQAFFIRANAQDQADLKYANLELQQELQLMQSLDNGDKGPQADISDTAINVLLSTLGPFLGRMTVSAREEWLRIQQEKWQHYRALLPSWKTPLGNGEHDRKLAELFDEHVHDSRAWFKPLGDDDDVWQAKKKQELAELAKRERQRQTGYGEYARPPSRQEQELLDKTRGKSGAELEKLLPTQNEGREPTWGYWGYLRWRALYRNEKIVFTADKAKAQQRKKAAERAKKQAQQAAIIKKALGGIYD